MRHQRRAVQQRAHVDMRGAGRVVPRPRCHWWWRRPGWRRADAGCGKRQRRGRPEARQAVGQVFAGQQWRVRDRRRCARASAASRAGQMRSMPWPKAWTMVEVANNTSSTITTLPCKARGIEFFLLEQHVQLGHRWLVSIVPHNGTNVTRIASIVLSDFRSCDKPTFTATCQTCMRPPRMRHEYQNKFRSYGTYASAAGARMDFSYSPKVEACAPQLSASSTSPSTPTKPCYLEEVRRNRAAGNAWLPVQVIEELKPQARASGPVEPVPAASRRARRRDCPTWNTRRCAKSWAG